MPSGPWWEYWDDVNGGYLDSALVAAARAKETKEAPEASGPPRISSMVFFSAPPRPPPLKASTLPIFVWWRIGAAGSTDTWAFRCF